MGNDNNSGKVEYIITNESLEAIVRGLTPHPKDSVLAICGSRDQALAILEKASKVVVVDYLPQQIKYFAKREEILKTGEFKRFLNPEEISSEERDIYQLRIRNRYFSEKRLKRIQPKLKSERIKIITGDLFDLTFTKKEFSKIYLSNILSYSFKPQTIKLAQGRLKKITEWLSDEGLIYLSDYNPIIQRAVHEGYAEDEKSFLDLSGLKINLELTEEVQRLQKRDYSGVTWNPAVLQKVA